MNEPQISGESGNPPPIRFPTSPAQPLRVAVQTARSMQDLRQLALYLVEQIEGTQHNRPCKSCCMPWASRGDR
jgi:hypothetical protein